MEISVSEQAVQLCLSLASGAALGLCYDVLRTLRRRFGRAAAQSLDLLFWLTAAFGLFSLGMSAGRGELRLFMLAGSGLGIVLYFWSLSPGLLRLFALAADFAAAVLRMCAFPFVKAASALKKSAVFFKKFFPKPQRWFTITINTLNSGTRKQTRTEVDRDEAQTRKYFY